MVQNNEERNGQMCSPLAKILEGINVPNNQEGLTTQLEFWKESKKTREFAW